jgi:hypothetical protein
LLASVARFLYPVELPCIRTAPGRDFGWASSMISAQTPSAFVAREKWVPVFRKDTARTRSESMVRDFFFDEIMLGSTELQGTV